MKLAQSFFSKKKLAQSCPFDQKKEKENKERNDRAAVEAVVNQHGFKTFKGCYRELAIVNYLHLWEILAEVELQPTKLFLFFSCLINAS